MSPVGVLTSSVLNQTTKFKMSQEETPKEVVNPKDKESKTKEQKMSSTKINSKDKESNTNEQMSPQEIYAKDPESKTKLTSPMNLIDGKSKTQEQKVSSPRKMSSGLATRMSNQIERIQNFREVRNMVDRRHTHGGAMDFANKRGLAKVSSRSNDFVYVNPGYTRSVNSVVNVTEVGPTSVVREQYWACSRWPLAQRALALAVGILLGAVIGLAATVAIRGGHRDSVAREATPG